MSNSCAASFLVSKCPLFAFVRNIFRRWRKLPHLRPPPLDLIKESEEEESISWPPVAPSRKRPPSRAGVALNSIAGAAYYSDFCLSQLLLLISLLLLEYVSNLNEWGYRDYGQM